MTDIKDMPIGSNQKNSILLNQIGKIVDELGDIGTSSNEKTVSSGEFVPSCNNHYLEIRSKEKTTNQKNQQMEAVENPFAFFMDKLVERNYELNSLLSSAKQSKEKAIKETTLYSEEAKKEREKLRNTLEILKKRNTSLERGKIMMNDAEAEVQHAENAFEKAKQEADTIHDRAIISANQMKEAKENDAIKNAARQKDTANQSYQTELKNIMDEYHGVTEKISLNKDTIEAKARENHSKAQKNANLSYQKAILLADSHFNNSIQKMNDDKNHLEEARKKYQDLLKRLEGDSDFQTAKKSYTHAEHMHAEASKAKQIAEKNHSECKRKNDKAESDTKLSQCSFQNAVAACEQSNYLLNAILAKEKVAEKEVFKQSVEVNTAHKQLIDARKLLESAKRTTDLSDHSIDSAKKNYENTLQMEMNASCKLEQAVINLKTVQKKKKEAENENLRLNQAKKKSEENYKEMQTALHECGLHLKDAEEKMRSAAAQFSRSAAVKESAVKKLSLLTQKYSFMLREAEAQVKDLEACFNSDETVDIAERKKAAAMEEAKKNLTESLLSADHKLIEDLKKAETFVEAEYAKAKKQRRQSMNRAAGRYTETVAQIESEKQHKISTAMDTYNREIGHSLADYRESISAAEKNLSSVAQKKKSAEIAVKTRKESMQKTEQELHSIAKRIETLEKKKQEAEVQARNANVLIDDLSKKKNAAEEELFNFRTTDTFSANIISKYDLGQSITLAI